MTDSAPYNPLDKTNLGASVAEALLGRKPRGMGEIVPFVGAGIYAIYYTGNFPAYARIAEPNRIAELVAPIYVGKAIPAGGRKGGAGLGSQMTKALYNRLSEHAESIKASVNLSIEDFSVDILS